MHCISIMYGTNIGVWLTLDPRGSYGVGLWKAIAKETPQLSKIVSWFLGMAKELDYGRTFGMGVSPCVMPSLIFIVLLELKGQWF